MTRLLLVFSCLVVAAAPSLAASDPNDAADSKDPALFSRMPGFHIYNDVEKDFDRYEFPVGPGKTQAIEGAMSTVIYYPNDGIKLPSPLQVVRNYANAAKSLGGKVVYAYEDGGVQYQTVKVVKGDVEAWAYVEASPNGIYSVRLVQKQLMKQGVEANAESLLGDIRSSGRATVYGIYFDTNKSELKPASEPTLVEIAKMLKTDPKLKLYVVGHTDNAGTFAANLELSEARAASVVAALTKKHGVAASRLKPFGAGPTCPVASNQTDAGRAKNRRVELVAQ